MQWPLVFGRWRKRRKESRMHSPTLRKKEACRKREACMTGGGPLTEFRFKPWEMTILSTLSPTAIHGLQGGADTGVAETEAGRETVSGPAGDCVVSGIVVTETVQVDTEPSCMYMSNESSQATSSAPKSRNCTPEKCQEKENKEKKKNKRPLGMEDMIELKRRKLDLEERKVHALERIATVLENQQINQHSPPLSISPVIKFH
uniref:Uncharacterized protein LOC111112726 n=1 Tax=Crassostrea virginica TaxID=6565 RepID=A0A8B8BS95_CRAVI|nr:uncharacterized protein LOC111112726 [Crassostrea virginica]XP_022306166.1 uncharacterized protein LOC111112726 [Crassostrea virginica]